jgi:hypothetical protein
MCAARVTVCSLAVFRRVVVECVGVRCAADPNSTAPPPTQPPPSPPPPPPPHTHPPTHPLTHPFTHSPTHVHITRLWIAPPNDGGSAVPIQFFSSTLLDSGVEGGIIRIVDFHEGVEPGVFVVAAVWCPDCQTSSTAVVENRAIL